MKKKNKYLAILLGLIGGISFFSLSGFDVKLSIFQIDSLFSKTENKIISLTERQIEDDGRWEKAKEAISNFYNYLNLFKYEKARSNLTKEFARRLENYSIEKLKEWEDKKAGITKIENFKKLEAESKNTTKVFSYETRYDMRSGEKNCGEKLIAYVVLRNNEWAIDTIQRDAYVKCE